jgi:hypothetical protein
MCDLYALNFLGPLFSTTKREIRKGVQFIIGEHADVFKSIANIYKAAMKAHDIDHWIMFDHVKRVKHWTTMAYHVYESVHCRVMTIVVCNMQSEDATAQSVLWKNLNDVMAKYGIP